MVRVKLFLCVTVRTLTGCGGPPATLDTSTDATTESTLKAMTVGMTDAEKSGSKRTA
jgi:hypothetical protein